MKNTFLTLSRYIIINTVYIHTTIPSNATTYIRVYAQTVIKCKKPRNSYLQRFADKSTTSDFANVKRLKISYKDICVLYEKRITTASMYAKDAFICFDRQNISFKTNSQDIAVMRDYYNVITPIRVRENLKIASFAACSRQKAAFTNRIKVNDVFKHNRIFLDRIKDNTVIKNKANIRLRIILTSFVTIRGNTYTSTHLDTLLHIQAIRIKQKAYWINQHFCSDLCNIKTKVFVSDRISISYDLHSLKFIFNPELFNLILNDAIDYGVKNLYLEERKY